jgi:dolichyl-phosphate beta-glucosyltransferase
MTVLRTEPTVGAGAGVVEGGHMREGLTVVVPAFDEEHRLPATLDRLVSGLGSICEGPWEVVVSDDGSHDATAEVALQRAGHGVRLVSSADHRGKGAALLAGIEAARHARVVLVDADLPVPVSVLVKMATMTDEAPLVVGSRRLPGANVDPPQPVLRAVGGRMFRSSVGLLGYRTGSDPQCGAKALRVDQLADSLRRVSCTGFAFDVELIELARRSGHPVVEVPVPWSHVEGSSLRPLRDATRTLVDLTLLRRRLPREASVCDVVRGSLTVQQP